MEIRKIRDASSLSLRKRQVRRSRDGVRRKGGPPAYVQRARASPGTGKNAAHSVRKPAGRYVRGSMTGIPDEVVMDLSDREIETFDKLPPAKQKALIRKAKNRAERAYISHSSDADTPENGSSHAAVSKSRRRMPDTGNYHVHGRNGTDSGGWKIWRREQMVSFFKRPGNSSKAEEMENGPAGTVPIQQTGSREMHPDPGRKSADRGREEGKDPRHAVFLKELRRGIAAAERTSRAREGQKREMREQWAAEQAERERVKDFLAVSAKSITRRITETAAHVKKAIISGSRLKLLLVLGPVGLLVIMLCLLMSMVSVTSTSQEVTYAAFGEEIVAYAKEWIGVTKYILGAGRNYETDWQDYTDCSGFVHGVYSHFGYEIGGNTNAMEDAAGTVIETNSLDLALPGDIILFYTGKIGHHYSTHVAIYAGDGKMIHCSGGAANVSPETEGRGVCWGRVENDGRQWEVRRVIPEGVIAGTGSGGHRVDPTRYTQRELELIWAVVAQEDNGSYDGALAVISCAMNRTESPNWSYLGSTAMQQLTAYGQFCYSMDDYWRPRLGGNVPAYVKQAVSDCLEKGIRNHSFTSFRSTKGKVTGPNAVQIGGNWFFGN